MKKRLFGWSAFLIFCFFFCFGEEKYVQAETGYRVLYTDSSREKQDRTIGKTTFEFDDTDQALYVVKDGNRRLVVSKTGLSSQILTNGKGIYYCLNNDDSSVSAIYHIRAVGEKGIKVFTARKSKEGFGYGDFNFAGLYDGKIYYVNGTDPGKFCSYSLKSEKQTTIAKNVTTADRYRQYFYLLPYMGGGSKGTLQVYDAKHHKLRVITKKLMYNYDVISDQLYYTETNTPEEQGFMTYFNMELKKCKLNGKDKVSLLKNLHVTDILKIKEHSITYIDDNGKKRTEKF